MICKLAKLLGISTWEICLGFLRPLYGLFESPFCGFYFVKDPDYILAEGAGGKPRSSRLANSCDTLALTLLISTCNTIYSITQANSQVRWNIQVD